MQAGKRYFECKHIISETTLRVQKKRFHYSHSCMIFSACFVFQAVDYELIALENGEKKNTHRRLPQREIGTNHKFSYRESKKS